METLKAGCFLINKNLKSVALIYRERHEDFSFPKGHLEEGESLKQCAIRETEEETKRKCLLVEEEEPYIERYSTSSGEKCACYMYVAIDDGVSDNDCEDTHTMFWIPFDKVEEMLSYDNLKNTWKENKTRVYEIMNKN